MEKSREKARGLMVLILVCCVVMAFMETVIEPAYAVKSATKAVVFLLFPLLYGRARNIKLFDCSFALEKKSGLNLLLLGVLIYAVVIGAYAATQHVFDYGALVDSLSTDQKVDSGSFIWVALYISFCNSFLEEFLFRFISFVKLSEYTDRKKAYAFSSVSFAVYHIAMIGTSFPLPLLVLAVMGLTAGGYIFDYVNEKNKNMYHSWVIHMFADFAIMTIWYLHI